MLISHRLKFVFLAVPRTASHSIRDALRRIAGPRAVKLADHCMDIPREYRDYFTFAFVRNPYARELSHYYYRKTRVRNKMHPWAKRWSFREYVEWSTDPERPPIPFHDKPQSQLLAGKRVDMILRFEGLPGSFYELPFVDSNMALPHLNKAMPGSAWRSSYCEELARMVYQWAQRDFELYGYDPDDWRHGAAAPDP